MTQKKKDKKNESYMNDDDNEDDGECHCDDNIETDEGDNDDSMRIYDHLLC